MRNPTKKIIELSRLEISLYDLCGKLDDVVAFLQWHATAEACKANSLLFPNFDWVRFETETNYGCYGERDRDVLVAVYERMETDEELADRIEKKRASCCYRKSRGKKKRKSKKNSMSE